MVDELAGIPLMFVTQRFNGVLPANVPFTFQKLDTGGAKVQGSI